MNSARSAREMREPTRSPVPVPLRTLTFPDPGLSLGAVTTTMGPGIKLEIQPTLALAAA